jgi:cell division protein FtsN
VKSRRHLSTNARPFLALMLALALLGPGEARAQAGPGAERYEVTITPPKRPGTGTTPEEGDATETESLEPGEEIPPAAADSAIPPGNSASAAETTSAPRRTVAAPAPTTAGPLRTLQVGAYRRRSSADQLRDALLATFRDVTVLEVESGGEPLYRVNVGRMPRGPALEDLKRRLLAAGHPAFEVLAPGSPKED